MPCLGGGDPGPFAVHPDVDKLSKEASRINRFIEVAPPSLGKLRTREWGEGRHQALHHGNRRDMQGTLQLLGSRPQDDQTLWPATGGY